MFSNNSSNSNNRDNMYRHSSNSYRGFQSNKRSSNVNPFNKERRFSNNSIVENKEQNENNTRFPRPYGGNQMQNRRNYSRPQYKRQFYSYEKKEVKKEPTFDLENNNFPSLSSGTASTPTITVKTNSDNNNTMNFSKMLQSTPITKEQAHPQPKKKFVSLVNLKKQTKLVEDEEFETDDEVQEMIDEQYNSMDEELEEYYNEEHEKEDYFDYDY